LREVSIMKRERSRLEVILILLIIGIVVAFVVVWFFERGGGVNGGELRSDLERQGYAVTEKKLSGDTTDDDDAAVKEKAGISLGDAMGIKDFFTAEKGEISVTFLKAKGDALDRLLAEALKWRKAANREEDVPAGKNVSKLLGETTCYAAYRSGSDLVIASGPSSEQAEIFRLIDEVASEAEQ
jgi:hypothetical protein